MVTQTRRTIKTKFQSSQPPCQNYRTKRAYYRTPHNTIQFIVMNPSTSTFNMAASVGSTSTMTLTAAPWSALTPGDYCGRRRRGSRSSGSATGSWVLRWFVFRWLHPGFHALLVSDSRYQWHRLWSNMGQSHQFSAYSVILLNSLWNPRSSQGCNITVQRDTVQEYSAFQE